MPKAFLEKCLIAQTILCADGAVATRRKTHCDKALQDAICFLDKLRHNISLYTCTVGADYLIVALGELSKQNQPLPPGSDFAEATA
jgi:hypothetical protein